MSRVVLVTGANGFLGRHAALYAANRGHCVVGVGHGKWSAHEWRAWGLSEWFEGDLTVDFLRGTGCQPNAILHCAGGSSVPYSITHPMQDFERTVMATAKVLEFVRLYSPGSRVVFSSSASIYGIAEQFPICETAPSAPISPYGVHKFAAEQLIACYARYFDVAASIIRYFSVYGQGLRKQLLWDACRKLHEGDQVFMGTGREIRDWLHVDDAAELMLIGLEYADISCPMVNGGGGEGVSTREILEHIADSLSGGDVSPRFSGRARTGDPPCYLADIVRAQGWGWRPKKRWREGVAEYAQWWLRENGERSASLIQSRASESAA